MGTIDPYLKIVKNQNTKVTPETFKRGTIVAIHKESCSADVIIVGSNESIAKNVPLSSAINANVVMPGDRCRIDMFDETNPDDSVIAYTYGRTYTYSNADTASVSMTIDGAGHGTGFIYHGLAIRPTIFGVSGRSYFGIAAGGGAQNLYSGVYINTFLGVDGADATKLYVAVDAGALVAGTYTFVISWFAAIV